MVAITICLADLRNYSTPSTFHDVYLCYVVVLQRITVEVTAEVMTIMS